MSFGAACRELRSSSENALDQCLALRLLS